MRGCSLLLALFLVSRLPAVQLSPAPPVQFDSILQKAKSLRESGRLLEAISTFEQAFQVAIRTHDAAAQAKALHGESGCYIRLFRYREALNTAERAYQLAVTSGDDTRAGAIAINKSTVYFALGDFQAADAAANLAVSRLEHSSDKNLLQKALFVNGNAKLLLGHHEEAIGMLRRAVAAARSANSPEMEAVADDYLGQQLVETGDLTGADKVLQDAKNLEIRNHTDAETIATQAHLADLRYRQKNYPEALSLIDGVLSSSKYDTTIPRYLPLQLKGRCLAALGQNDAALDAFAQAVADADRWRRNVLPGDTTSTNTVASLSDIYLDFVNQAATMSLARHNPALARRALEVLISNRASNLRDEIISGLGRELLLPPHYYELLSMLQSTQARVTLGRDAKARQADEVKLRQIRSELSELENNIGVQGQNFSPPGEKNSLQTSLISIQSHLSRDELLLSFSLGEGKSFLWTVTGAQVNLYALPSAKEITPQARAFTDSVASGHLNAAQGVELSRALFGKIPAATAAKPHWLLAADGALLDGFPFSALPDPLDPAHSSLAAARTLRLVPSEALRSRVGATQSAHTFLGIADPIYNQADPRRHGNLSLVSMRQTSRGLSLGRLVGSEREVKSSAVATGLPEVHILTGPDATVSHIQALLSTKPEIIHFAVHVISPQDAGTKSEAALALSLTGDDVPELLTKETIARLRVPGSLVVLSGCASQQGEVLPGAGLVGLSRAWLLAGASAVLVTAWPIPDDSGHFFQSFYSQMRATSGSIGERAAIALEKAQSDMRSGSGYRSNPAFWAAYSLISKE
jgi:tetratricopeptide (TPR) repeat protein